MTFAEALTEYWGVTLFIFGLIFHALFMYFKINNHETRIANIEDNKKEIDEAISEIKQHIAGIHVKLELIINSLEIKSSKRK